MLRYLTTALLTLVSTGAMAQSPIERGGYLVNGILTCGNCHTPKGPGGVELTAQMHAGGVIEWDTPTFKVKGSNITMDRDTGIGSWTDAQIKAAIQNGVRPHRVVQLALGSDNRSVRRARVLAASLKDFVVPGALPGIKLNTSATDFAPFESVQLARFDGKEWVRFGRIIGK